jgi:hypothetical protein
MRYAEHEAQKAVCLWWKCQHKALGVRWEHLLLHVPNGQHSSARAGARQRAQGLRAGVPDLFLAVPRGPYHGLWIEMKAARGTLQESQKLFHPLLIAQGYHVTVSKGWEDATRQITAYLKLPDEMKGAA